MANKKISELTSASLPLAGTEEIPIVQSGVTKKATLNSIKQTLQQVTDSGSTTTNDITIESDSYYSLLTSSGLNLNNNTTLDNISISPIEIALRDDVYSSTILSRTRTQNTDFYFEDEGGEKSIATREWVNAKNNLQWLVKDTTPTTAVTGTTSVAQIGSSVLIAANTFSAEDLINVDSFACQKTAGLGTCVLSLYHNTSNTLTGATFILAHSMALNTVSAKVIRTFEITGGLLKARVNGGSSAFTDIGNITVAPLSISFDPTIDNYFFTTVTLSNASDSVTRTQLLISK